MPKVIQVIGGATDPDERIRIEWGQSLEEHLDAQGVTLKQLRHRLNEEHGISVSRQAVEAWLAGQYSPRPSVQAAIGSILNVPARRIFDIQNAPRVAA